VVDALRGIGEEFTGLLGRTGVTWWRLAPWLLGLCLLGWVGNYGAVLLGTELTFYWPWLVILGLAIGTVAQLATIVIALRFVMEHNQVRLGSMRVLPGERPPSPVQLVARTILPFLAIYAAFGFVDDYARNVVLAMTGRYGLGSVEFLSALNPVSSPQTLATAIGIIVVLYLLRRGLDWLAGRHDRIWIGLVGAVVEASWLLVLFLSAFRLVESAWLWLNERQLAAWWGALRDALFGWIHLTGFWLTAWEFLAAEAWPALWDMLAQPLAWLALAVVVAGIKVATTAELLEAHGEGVTSFAKVANGFFTGDLDDKFAPLWNAVRFLAAAGLPLLGGYVLAFTAIDLIGELVAAGVDQLIGPQYDKAAVRVMPFYDLIQLVLVMAMRLALLGATVGRVSEVLAAGRTPSRHRISEAVTVFVVCIALALSSIAIRPPTGVWEETAAVNAELSLMGGRVRVGEPQAGRMLTNEWGARNPTDLVFLVVPVSLTRERGSVHVGVSLRAGERRYQPWDGSGQLTTDPGFTTERDIVFELDPADLTQELTVELHPGASMQLGELIGLVPLPAPTPADEVSYRGSQIQWVP